MKKEVLMKSGTAATIISILTGIANIIMSFFGKSVVGSMEDVSQSIPWVQTLLIMAGVFVVVFVFLMIYYFNIKKKVEEMPI